MTNPRTPASAWCERVAHWRSSDLQAHVYAAKNNLSVDRLRYWSARMGRETQMAQLLSVRVQPPLPTAAPLELRSPSGWLMRIEAGADPVWLAAVLQAQR
ncbi:hypothetical protein MRBLMS1_003388 [Massilia sp. LMS1-1-1.1]